MDLHYTPVGLPLYVMVKPVSSTCNLNCSYCYYLEKGRIYSGREDKQMSEFLLERFIRDYIELQSSPEILFTWHGGEPLLRGLDFFKKSIGFQRFYARNKYVNISNSLQTNGILLTDEWCEFFAKNNFLIGISLDGPEHCHDRYRKNYADSGTYEKVIKGIRLLQSHGVEFNILSVVNDYNVNYPVEIYRHFKELDCHYIQFTPVVERLAVDILPEEMKLMPPGQKEKYKLAEWNVDPLSYGIFLTEIFKEWVKKDVSEYYVINFDSILANWIGQSPSTCTHARICGHAMVMEYNGDVFACDHFVFPEYKQGNILTKSLLQILHSNEQVQFGKDKYTTLPEICVNCEYLFACNGGCPKDRIIETCQKDKNLNYLCPGLKYYFKSVTPYMDFMSNELRNNRPPANVKNWISKLK